MSGTQDLEFMRAALKEAELALAHNEVPIGAVLVYENKIIASASNRVIAKHDATAHAEIEVLRQGGAVLNNYRLLGCSLYVTLEPCPMCWAAMIHARITRVVFATANTKEQHLQFNHQLEQTGGVLSEQAKKLLDDFFRVRR